MKANQAMKHVIFATAVAVAFSGLASATTTSWTLEERLTSAGGAVVIGEFSHMFDSNLVGYEVDLDPETSIHLFAVSHSDSDPNLFLSAASGWSATNVQKDNWASGTYGFNGFIAGSSLGSFESLFGTVDTHVVVFTAPAEGLGEGAEPGVMSHAFMNTNPEIDRSDLDESEWESVEFSPRFTRGGGTSSEFIAVNSSGMIIGQSIPEPGAALLVGLSAFGFAAIRRRSH